MLGKPSPLSLFEANTREKALCLFPLMPFFASLRAFYAVVAALAATCTFSISPYCGELASKHIWTLLEFFLFLSCQLLNIALLCYCPSGYSTVTQFI